MSKLSSVTNSVASPVTDSSINQNIPSLPNLATGSAIVLTQSLIIVSNQTPIVGTSNLINSVVIAVKLSKSNKDTAVASVNGQNIMKSQYLFCDAMANFFAKNPSFNFPSGQKTLDLLIQCEIIKQSAKSKNIVIKNSDSYYNNYGKNQIKEFDETQSPIYSEIIKQSGVSVDYFVNTFLVPQYKNSSLLVEYKNTIVGATKPSDSSSEINKKLSAFNDYLAILKKSYTIKILMK